MSSVQQALTRLSRAIGTLESSVHHMEGAMKGKQRDMFAAPAFAPAVANSNGIDTELVAEKLDSAIARIESVLKEGRA